MPPITNSYPWAGNGRRGLLRQQRQACRTFRCSDLIGLEYFANDVDYPHGANNARPGFQIVTHDDLERWSYESANPLLQFERATDAIKQARAALDPIAVSLLPKPDRRRIMRELRQIAYRQRHQRRRDRPRKLTYLQCQEIKRLLVEGVSTYKLATRFGVSQGYVWKLGQGERRTNWGEAS